MENNYASKNQTNFLCGYPLIEEAHSKYGLCSENWAYPTQYKFGHISTPYYAEVWSDGMDWNSVYWLLESINYSSATAIPIIIFDEGEKRIKFNSYDFGQLIEFIMWNRMQYFWIKNGDRGVYGDTVVPYLKKIDPVESYGKSGLVKCYFEHASQKRVEFFLNENECFKYNSKPIINNCDLKLDLRIVGQAVPSLHISTDEGDGFDFMRNNDFPSQNDYKDWAEQLRYIANVVEKMNHKSANEPEKKIE
ncbi:MAG: hypothetical protein WCW65_03185 [Candidatus Paceibacterota bacterium]|jgi:hypothetical protein